MNAIKLFLRELFGLFIDDGSLALAILTVIGLAIASSFIIPNLPLITGAILLFGCVGVLLVNLAIARQR